MERKSPDIRTETDSPFQHAGGGHPHAPRDTRGGSDARAGSGRKPATQNDMPREQAVDTEQWQEDLHRDEVAGRNQGMTGAHPEKAARTAYDVKPVHRRMNELTDDELKRIPIMPPGSHLEQGATYVDLRHPERGEFTAMGGQQADDHHTYAPKSDVEPHLWNRLIGVKNAERLGEASEGEHHIAHP